MVLSEYSELEGVGTICWYKNQYTSFTVWLQYGLARQSDWNGRFADFIFGVRIADRLDILYQSWTEKLSALKWNTAIYHRRVPWYNFLFGEEDTANEGV